MKGKVFVLLASFGVPQNWFVVDVFEHALDALSYKAGETKWTREPNNADDTLVFTGTHLRHQYEDYQIVEREVL